MYSNDIDRSQPYFIEALCQHKTRMARRNSISCGTRSQCDKKGQYVQLWGKETRPSE